MIYTYIYIYIVQNIIPILKVITKKSVSVYTLHTIILRNIDNFTVL